MRNDIGTPPPDPDDLPPVGQTGAGDSGPGAVRAGPGAVRAGAVRAGGSVDLSPGDSAAGSHRTVSNRRAVPPGENAEVLQDTARARLRRGIAYEPTTPADHRSLSDQVAERHHRENHPGVLEGEGLHTDVIYSLPEERGSYFSLSLSVIVIAVVVSVLLIIWMTIFR